MNAIKLTDKVYWVGAIDWKIRDFHGYTTNKGTTYNAYLILAEKVTLVDTVKAPFKDEMMARIASVIPPSKIKYIISNHSEMDHSGSLPQVIDEIKPEKVFASIKGVGALKDHFHMDREIVAIKDGESLSLGNMKTTSYETRMLHWPDSMITYLHEEKILFSQDAFGMHLASDERFDDELDASLLEDEALKYYANIITPFSPLVTKVLARLGELNLSIKLLAPDHGPIWRKDINKIIGLYSKWAEQRPLKKAVIVYDTMWKSTATMAEAIKEGVASSGAEAKLMPLSSFTRSDVATELLCAGAFLAGSPTLNNQLFPTVADMLVYIKGLKFKVPMGAAFGSYGWSGESIKHISETLKEMKIELLDEGLNIRYVPRPEDLDKCVKLGRLVGEKLKNY